ncbi:hypothetical protein CEXT_248021, partial [Caerostris extrusa]
ESIDLCTSVGRKERKLLIDVIPRDLRQVRISAERYKQELSYIHEDIWELPPSPKIYLKPGYKSLNKTLSIESQGRETINIFTFQSSFYTETTTLSNLCPTPPFQKRHSTTGKVSVDDCIGPSCGTRAELRMTGLDQYQSIF